ncbi:unnamed protein product [Rhizopus stolonifer]
MVENALNDALKSWKPLQKRGQALVQELNILKVISQEGLASEASANASFSTVKLADNINKFGSSSQTNNNISQRRKRKFDNKPGKLQVDVCEWNMAVFTNYMITSQSNKGNQFLKTLGGPILAINKPRITEINASQIKSAFEICISSTPSTPSSEVIENEYKKNVENQHKNKCLEEIPKVQKFLQDLTNGEYNELLDTIYTQKVDGSYSGIERQYMQFLNRLWSTIMPTVKNLTIIRRVMSILLIASTLFPSLNT